MTATAPAVTWKSADGTVTENDAAAAAGEGGAAGAGTGLCDGTGKPGVGMQPGRKTPFTPVLWATPTNWYSYQGHCSGQLCRERRAVTAHLPGAASCLGIPAILQGKLHPQTVRHKAQRLPDEQRALPGRGGKRSEQPVRDRRDAVLSFAGRGDGMGRKPADKGIRCAGHQRADCGGLGHGREAWTSRYYLYLHQKAGGPQAGRLLVYDTEKGPVARGKRCRAPRWYPPGSSCTCGTAAYCGPQILTRESGHGGSRAGNGRCSLKR